MTVRTAIVAAVAIPLSIAAVGHGEELEFISIPAVGFSSAALDINDTGTVVGFVGLSNGYAAFRWTLEGGRELLPFPEGVNVAKAVAVNEAGVIAGWAPVSGGTAGLPLAWRPDGTLVDLSFLSTLAVVEGITEAGVIFGSANGIGACTFGTIDAPELRPLDASFVVGSRDDAIVGSSVDARPVVIRPKSTDMLALPSGFTSAVARGMGTDGTVVGSGSFFQYPNTRHRAFVRSPEGTPQQLPSFSAASDTRAMDRNAAGRTVGYGTGGPNPGCSAWIHDGGAMINAETMLTLPGGVEHCDLVGINESGWMVGRSWQPGGSSGQFRAFVIRPVDVTPPCPADIDGDGAVGPADIGALLAFWGGSDASADLDGDGTVGPADLGLLAATWGDCPTG